MAVTEYLARQACIVVSEGAVQVSKPACAEVGAGVGVGVGVGVPVGVGVGVGVGVEVRVGVGVGFGVGIGFGIGAEFPASIGQPDSVHTFFGRPNGADRGLTWRIVASARSTRAGSVP